MSAGKVGGEWSWRGQEKWRRGSECIFSLGYHTAQEIVQSYVISQVCVSIILCVYVHVSLCVHDSSRLSLIWMGL